MRAIDADKLHLDKFDDNSTEYRRGWNDALDITAKKAPTVEVPTWIPVTERLPEKNTTVIVATDNGIVFQCLYAYDGWDLWEGNEVNITHWMPLPTPPKGGE